MTSFTYPVPKGVHAIPLAQLDTRPYAEIDRAILNPPPLSDSIKNAWFFWHTGYTHMHPYTRRNVRAWYRRLTPLGWSIRVLDLQPDSPLNVSNFLDVTDPSVFPQAFVDGAIDGAYGIQHTSDLVRWPLLLRYGGVYADVGMLQIGDLNALFDLTVGDPSSGYDVLAYFDTSSPQPSMLNYFLCSGRDNALFARCHKLLLALWEGKVSTEGMHASPLLKGVKMLNCPSFCDTDGRFYDEEEAGRMLTDYIIQGSTLTAVMGLVDKDDGWNGPEYIAKHVYGVDFMTGSQLINEMTAWDGPRQFKLMSLSIPKQGEIETADQKLAREIVEACLSKSFGFKLATGMIVRVMGQTLSSLWRSNEGADDVPGTYAHWLRYGIANWCQDELPKPLELNHFEPSKVGKLLSA